MNLAHNLLIALSGRFTMFAHSSRGTRLVAAFDNLILNAGLNQIGTAGADSFCQVGTGSTAPAVTDTALVSLVAGTSTVQSAFPTNGTYVAGPPAYVEASKTWRFAAGAAAGNLAEVGIGWASSGSLFSRALILDGGGAPTTITILSDEVLDVTYTSRVYLPADVTGTVTIAGVNYDYTLRPIGVAANWNPGNLIAGAVADAPGNMSTWSGTLGSLTANLPNGTQAGSATTTTLASYSNGSYARAATWRCGLNDGNLGGGFKTAYLAGANPNGFGARQIEFSTNIPKDNTKVFNITSTLSWSRRP